MPPLETQFSAMTKDNVQSGTMRKRGFNRLVLVTKPHPPQPPRRATGSRQWTRSNNSDDCSSNGQLTRHGRYKLERRTTTEGRQGRESTSSAMRGGNTQSSWGCSDTGGMKRFGKHKLVLTRPRDSQAVVASEQKSAIMETTGNEQQEQQQRSREQGDNSNKGKKMEHVQEPDPVGKQPLNSSSSLPLKKLGHNKLVQQSSSQSHPPSGESRKSYSKYERKRRRPTSRHCVHFRDGKVKSIPSAKRIKIAVKASDQSDVDTTSTLEEEGSKPDDTSTVPPKEKLTDFAYRETSKVKQRGGSKKWDASTAGKGGYNNNPNQQQRSMGLVRVQPDQRKTPICPAFLKGVECTDKYCTKRHDVPKEFAMPICSFFEHHGLCLRADECKFRHVKVNREAIDCPSFAWLGFCETKDCRMKHVRQAKKKK